jgi:hypothetical protein
VTDEARPLLEQGGGRIFTWPPSVVAIVAELAGWPRVEYGALTIEGEPGWRDALRRASIAEHPRLLELLGAPWATSALLATPAARDRLGQWFAAGRPTPTPHDLVRRLRFLGDSEIRSVLLRALHERIPPAVVAFLLDRALFCGVGWSAGGWTIQAALPPGACAVILLSGSSHDEAAVLDLTLHEAAHAWLIETPREPLRAEAVHNETAAALLAAAANTETMRGVLRASDAAERQADALAATWGGHLHCSPERDRAYTVHEAHRLSETYGKP